MCLGVPMKIIEVNRELGMAKAEISGFIQNIRIDLLDEVSAGDYVIVHAGFAIQKLNEKDALETLKLIEEIFFDDEVSG